MRVLDIDECVLNKHECHKYAECTNLSPGYKCRCKHGFVEYSNGRDCRGECTFSLERTELSISSTREEISSGSRMSSHQACSKLFAKL